MAEQLNLSINVSGNVEESLGSIKKQLREAQNEVTALSDKFGATSKEAVQAAKRAGELKDRIGDAKALTEAFNPDAKFKALSASLSGVAGGFAAVQGAIGLFGGESKELEKQLLKVQSAMALSQGLQSVGESIDSFKNLGTVIKSSTAFLKANELATKGAALATRLFGGAVDTTAVSFKVLKGAIAATGIGLLVVAIGFLVEKLMNMGKASEEAAEKQKELNLQLANTTKEAIKQSEKFIDSDTKLKVARAKLAGASEKELLEIEQEGIRAKTKIRERNYEDLLKTDKKAASDLAQQNADAQDELALNQLNFQIAQKEKADAIKKEKDKKAAELKAETLYYEGLTALEKKNQERITTVQSEGLMSRGIEAVNITKLNTNAVVQLNEEVANKIKNSEQIGADYSKKKAEEKKALDIQTAMQTLDIIGGMVDKNSIAGKGIAVAQAIINTYQGASKAIAQGGTFGPILAAATIAAGLLNVKKIISTPIPSAKGTGSVGGASGGGGGVSAGFSSSPIQPQAPQAQLTQLNQSSINAIGNQSMRAYVVETDVTSSQQRIAAIQQRARFQ
jgi:hypothetical protein